MRKARSVKPMFRLSPVEFRDSAIAGRGVFARRAFQPGEVVAAYAPRQRKVDVRDAEAAEAAETKLTLLSGDRVIIPDTTVPGGWLCNLAATRTRPFTRAARAASSACDRSRPARR